MKKDAFIDNTKPWCFGYQPEPEKHDAFVGWRTIFHRNSGKPYLDYVQGRGSCRGLSKECDALVRWWSRSRGCPEKWWLKNACNSKDVAVVDSETKYGKMTAMIRQADGYCYISLYLDKPKEKSL